MGIDIVEERCVPEISEEGRDSGSEEERKDNDKVEDICETNSPDFGEENVEASSQDNDLGNNEDTEVVYELSGPPDLTLEQPEIEYGDDLEILIGDLSVFPIEDATSGGDSDELFKLLCVP